MKLFLQLVSILSVIQNCICGTNTLALNRAKRYVIFPEGASLSIAICFTHLMITPFTFLSEGLNWGITYDLPTNSTMYHPSYFRKHLQQRRYRRGLYEKIELVLNSMGYSGRSCIYRALCESGRKQHAQKDSLVENDILEEVFQTIFKFTMKQMASAEPEEHRLYHWAFHVGQIEPEKECWEMYPDCSVSVLDVFTNNQFFSV